MATTVPTPPTFTAGDHSIANIEALANCVRFLVGDIRPMWHTFLTNTRSLSASTWTTITYANSAYDSEAQGAGGTGILATSNGVATIQTQGIYAVESCATFVSTGTAFYCQSSFLWTAGSSNPNFTVGSNKRFGLRGQTTIGSAGVQIAVCCADTTPVTCYPGDTIVHQVWGASAVTVQTNISPVPTYDTGRFATDFTGHWIRTGV